MRRSFLIFTLILALSAPNPARGNPPNGASALWSGVLINGVFIAATVSLARFNSERQKRESERVLVAVIDKFSLADMRPGWDFDKSHGEIVSDIITNQNPFVEIVPIEILNHVENDHLQTRINPRVFERSLVELSGGQCSLRRSWLQSFFDVPIDLSPILKQLDDQEKAPGLLSQVNIHSQLNEAYSRGVRIFNCSLGLNSRTFPIVSLFFKEHPDAILIAAAGNEGASGLEDLKQIRCKMLPVERSLQFPVTEPNVISVSALDCYIPMQGRFCKSDRHGTIADYSNHGRDIAHLAAPGILKNIPTKRGDLDPVEGTSFAAPLVTRTFAGIKLRNPKANPEEMIEILKERLVKSKSKLVKHGTIWGGSLDETAVLEAVCPR